MKIRIGGVVCEEVSARLMDVCNALEDWLQPRFEFRDYGGGVEQLSVMLVSVDDDSAENARFAFPHERAGYYRHPITARRVRYVSVAIAMSPSSIEALEYDAARVQVTALIVSRLRARLTRTPTGFDSARCFEDVCLELELLRQHPPSASCANQSS